MTTEIKNKANFRALLNTSLTGTIGSIVFQKNGVIRLKKQIKTKRKRK